MSKPTPKRPELFIEKMMPVQLLNDQVYYEHGGNPFKGLHRWYSRKPLSFSRASVLASLLPADVTMKEFEYLLGLEPGKEVKLYKTPPTSMRIKKVQDYCEKVWGTRTPTILDAFAGGGSIPFEAARYGLNVLASDLNPVAVVTMKAAMEYPLKFGPDLQQDIDKWVKWVGDEAEKRLAEFFPSLPGETVQNYLWAHTVVCPSCESVVPLSPNWWLYKRPEKQNLHKWCAVKPVPNPENKRVDFELIKGRKGKGTTIIYNNSVPVVRASRSLDISDNKENTSHHNGDILTNSEQDARTTIIENEYEPDTTTTISRGDGKCPNCGHLIEGSYIDNKLLEKDFDYALYAIACKLSSGNLEFRLPTELDLESIEKAKSVLGSYINSSFIPSEPLLQGQDTRCYNRGVRSWYQIFHPRQLLTLRNRPEYISIVDSQQLTVNS